MTYSEILASQWVAGIVNNRLFSFPLCAFPPLPAPTHTHTHWEGFIILQHCRSDRKWKGYNCLSSPITNPHGNSLNFTITSKCISSEVSLFFFYEWYVPTSLKCKPFYLLSQFLIIFHSSEFLSQSAITGSFSLVF